MKPVLIMIAGPNGAGKTTITKRLQSDHWSAGVEYLNPDDVARDRFGDWNSPKAVLEAAVWTTDRRETLLAERAGIAFETVFSSDDKVDFLQRASSGGYFTRLFFVSTGDPRINAFRVASRVLKGGHTVPIEKILARYVKSVANLSVAVPIADRVYLFDNSIEGTDAKLVARTSAGLLRKVYGPVPQWIDAVIQNLAPHPSFEDLRPD